MESLILNRPANAACAGRVSKAVRGELQAADAGSGVGPEVGNAAARLPFAVYWTTVRTWWSLWSETWPAASSSPRYLAGWRPLWVRYLFTYAHWHSVCIVTACAVWIVWGWPRADTPVAAGYVARVLMAFLLVVVNADHLLIISMCNHVLFRGVDVHIADSITSRSQPKEDQDE